jgi:PhzF family phenazine biosynthesis protein
MRKIIFKKVDAFATDVSTGNPAAVVYLDSFDELSQNEMQTFAKDLKGFVSEVGYVCPGVKTDFQFRYFSSEREVAFCGHATIAIFNDMLANNPLLQDKPVLTFAVNTESLVVDNRYKVEKCVYISAPFAKFSSTNINKKDLAIALGCQLEDMDASLPLQVLNAGLETLIVPIASLNSILSITPNLQKLKDYCLQIGVDIVVLFCNETTGQDSSYRSRVFAATFGYLEDPATGSGNAALGYYLLKHRKWNGEKITIEQNASRDLPNFVFIYAKQEDNDRSQIWFGGEAKLKMVGQYYL